MNYSFIKKDKIGCYLRSGKWLLRPTQQTQIPVGAKVEVIISPEKKAYMICYEKKYEPWVACSDFISYIAVRRQYRNDYGEIFKILYEPVFAGKNAVYNKEWKTIFKLIRDSKQKYISNKRNYSILNYFRTKRYKKNKL